MDVEQAIATRRMVGKVKDLIPSRGEIEKLLAAAVAAPNHHLTEPWRFIVLTGEALDELGEAMALRVGEKYPEAPDLADRVGRELARPKRAPIIIAVLYVPSSHPKAIDMEDRIFFLSPMGWGSGLSGEADRLRRTPESAASLDCRNTRT